MTNVAIPLKANWSPARDSIGKNYEDLLSSNLGEISNNASLILRRTESLCEEGWLGCFEKLNTNALQISCEHTDQAMRGMLEAAGCQRPLRILSIMRKGARLILDCVMIDRISGMDTLDLGRTSNAFLKLAIDIEGFLANLLFEREVLASKALATV